MDADVRASWPTVTILALVVAGLSVLAAFGVGVFRVVGFWFFTGLVSGSEFAAGGVLVSSSLILAAMRSFLEPFWLGPRLA